MNRWELLTMSTKLQIDTLYDTLRNVAVCLSFEVLDFVFRFLYERVDFKSDTSNKIK